MDWSCPQNHLPTGFSAPEWGGGINGLFFIILVAPTPSHALATAAEQLPAYPLRNLVAGLVSVTQGVAEKNLPPTQPSWPASGHGGRKLLHVINPPAESYFMADSIAQLVEGCRQGRPAAQRALYERLSYLLMGVCLRYCPNRADAEDALQVTFVKIFTHLDQYQGKGPFEAWARRIAVTTSLNAYHQHRQLGPQVEVEAAEQLHHPDGTPLEMLSAEEIMQLLHTLPVGYRTVLNLYAIEGYSHAEISQLLGISEGTSKSQLSRARQLLEQRLLTKDRIPTH